METINWWILAPMLIFLSLITIPIVYVWVSVYGARLRLRSTENPVESIEKSIEVESATTEVPENLAPK